MGGKARVGLAQRLEGALRDVARAFEANPHGMVIGGIAVIARGVPRTTRDIDVTFAGTTGVAPLAAQLARVGISPRIPDAEAFAAESQVLLMRHVGSGVDIDVSCAWLAFELEAIAAARRETIAGVSLPIARPEDLVIYKAIAWRPQDQQDVERLLVLHGDHMDLDRIRRHVRELAEALEVDRLADLEATIRRVLAPRAIE